MNYSKVNIVPDENGNVIRQSKNPELGYVRLAQDRITINSRGWVNKKTFSTLLKGSIEDLQSMGINTLSTLPGNIVVKESTTPFNMSEPNRDLKIAGDTGIILCTKDGEPIYRTTLYDASGCMQDELVAHANGNAIKEKINKTKSSEPIVEKNKQQSFSFDSLKNNDSEEEIDDMIEDVVEEVQDVEEELEEYDEDIEFDL